MAEVAAVFRIMGRPQIQTMRELDQARNAYFRAHHSNDWPPHDCDAYKRVNYAAWSIILEKPVTTARDMDTEDWIRLESRARRARTYAKHYTPEPFRVFREYRRLVRTFTDTGDHLALLRQMFDAAGVDL